MKSTIITIFLIVLLALMAGGCSTQPSAQAQAEVDAAFTLETKMKDTKMVFIGTNGEIKGASNPDLIVREGDTVLFRLVNGDGIPHDFAIPELGVQTSMVMAKDQVVELVFVAEKRGEFAYYCTVSGHRQAGMEGKFIVIAAEGE